MEKWVDWDREGVWCCGGDGWGMGSGVVGNWVCWGGKWVGWDGEGKWCCEEGRGRVKDEVWCRG